MSVDPRRAGLNTFAGWSWPAGRTLPITGIDQYNAQMYTKKKKNINHPVILGNTYILLLLNGDTISFFVSLSSTYFFISNKINFLKFSLVFISI
jgi:hypothetical protein